MNRFYQYPLAPAWKTARFRAVLIEPPSRSRRPAAMTLHKPVDTIYDRPLKPRRHLPLSAAFPYRVMTPLYQPDQGCS